MTTDYYKEQIFNHLIPTKLTDELPPKDKVVLMFDMELDVFFMGWRTETPLNEGEGEVEKIMTPDGNCLELNHPDIIWYKINMENTLTAEKEIFEYIHARLNKQFIDLTWYIDHCFTKEEAVRHSDNLHGLMTKNGELFAYIELIKMKHGVKNQSL